MEPTLAAFQQFVVQTMGISTTILPSSRNVITMCYNVAIATVACELQCFGFTDPWTGQQSSLYALAVYNYAGAILLIYAQDLPDAPIVPGSKNDLNPNGLPFFAWSRRQFNLLGYVGGTIQSSSDQGTSQSMVIPEAAETFTIENLELTKTPWGRQYLSIAQKLGPSLFGIT